MLFSLTGGMMTVSAVSAESDFTRVGGEITGYSGSGGAVIIPSTIGGVAVTGIADNAFFNNKAITSVTIPSGATRIGYSAFFGCTSLQSITIPASVTNIESTAIYGCSALTTIIVNGSNTVYSSNNGLLFNKAVTELILCAPGNTGEITIPISVLAFRGLPFTSCTKITKLSIPSGITLIYPTLFESCAALTSFSVDVNNTAYSSENGMLLNKDGTTLVRCPVGISGIVEIPDSVTSIGANSFTSCKATGITIPTSVTAIGDSAFNYCRALTDITIPGSVTNIGNNAFDSCAALKSASFLEANAPTLGANVFKYNHQDFKIYYSSHSAGFATPWNGYTTEALPAHTITIGTFDGGSIASTWSSASLGETVGLTITPDKGCALKGGTLKYNDGSDHIIVGTSFTMPGSNVTISAQFDSNYIFDSTSGKITSYIGEGGVVVIPDRIDGVTVSGIETEAFKSCTSLTAITIPANITNIGESAFNGCSGLESAFFMGNAPTLGSVVFANCNPNFIVKYVIGSSEFTEPTWKTYNSKAYYIVTFDKNSGDTEASPSTVATTGAAIGTLPTAPARAGYAFSRWNAVANGSGTAFTASTEVIANITVYAQWTVISAGNGGSTGGSSSGSNTGIIPVVTPKPTLTETSPTGNSVASITSTTSTDAKGDSKGTAVASVTQSQLTDALKEATEAAAKKGEGIQTKIEIRVNAPADTKSVETRIPLAAFNAVEASNTSTLTVTTPIAALTFDAQALSAIAGGATGEIKITTSIVEAASLSDETKQAVGDRPVFNFSVTSGNQTISQFGGKVTVAVPYTPKAGENLDAIVIYYINAEGKLEIVSNCSYDPTTGSITFTTNHFSKYAVGYNKVTFTDVATNAWYSKAVEFAAARGITTGTGEGTFSPDNTLTRGQFLVMAMRANDIQPLQNPNDNFTDAGNTYYTGYLAAAKGLGITDGIGNNHYAPEAEITRQEMFTLLYKILKFTGELPTGTTDQKIATFSDSDTIEPWAMDAVTLFVKTGVINGSHGKLTPTGTTNRAEMAQVLYNLLTQ